MQKQWQPQVKKIEAIIKPFKLDEVRDALGDMGLNGMTVTEVVGTGRREPSGDIQMAGMLPRVKLEMVVPDDQVNRAVEAIIRSGRTGKPGDGKVFVYSLKTAVRIRTEESGSAAI